MDKKYRLIEVTDDKTRREFLKLPVRLYKNEENWVRPLDQDIETVFDPSKNKYFRHGELIRWILKDENDQAIGRVAAFVDNKTAKTYEQPTGGMGFFECINDKDAAFILFDACKEWQLQKGMEAMDGPINFGGRDKWWGLLVDGFYQPNYCMPYNFKYYQELFEAYGFQNYYNQYTYYSLIVDTGIRETVREKAIRIAKNPDYYITMLQPDKIEKFIDDFRIIYNKAWGKYAGASELTTAHVKGLFNSLKPIMDKQLLWYAYYKDEPAAFFLMIPEINVVIKKLKGKFNLWAKIKFFYYFKIRKICKKAFGVIFGVVPEHQGKGLEASMIMAYAEQSKKPCFPYIDMEMNWIGDFNPSMMRINEDVGARIRKTHITYRYLFDRTKEFTRAPRRH